MTTKAAYKSIALVDLSAVFAQVWFGVRHTNIDPVEKCLAQLDRINETVEHMILCVDSPPYFRSTLYPAYKAHRDRPEPEMHQARFAVLTVAGERGYRIAEAESFEGDDIVATLTHVYRRSCDDVRIIGSDKDLFQLVNGKVRMFIPAKGDKPEQLVDAAGVIERMGVAPNQMVDWQALAGDPGDNIQGCPLVADKRATKLLAMYDTLDGLFAAAEKRPAETCEAVGKTILANLIEFKPQILAARTLVRLSIEAPVDADELLVKGEPSEPSEPVPPVPAEDADSAPASERRPAVAEAPEAEAPEIEGEPVASNDVKPEAPEATAEPKPAEPKPEPKPEPASETVERQSATSTALVPGASAAWDLALEPRNMTQAWWLAERFAPLYPDLGGPGGTLAVILMGRELGLGTMSALQNFAMVKGRPSPRWQLIVAFTQQHPDCEYFRVTATDAEHATYVCKRRGDPERSYTYTIEMARTAGLVKSDSGWHRHPEAMLRKMCAVHLARMVFPDSKASGLYFPGELAA